MNSTMESLTNLRLRLRALFHRRQLDQDLDEELQFHLAMRENELRQSGLDANDAAGLARRRFGNTAGTKEATRDLWSFPALESVWKDLRYGARMLWRSPVFTAVAVLSLALGIGANTLVFSLFNGVMLKPLPVPRPSELRVLNWSGQNVSVSYYYGSGMSGGGGSSFSYPGYEAFRDADAGFSDVFAFSQLSNVSVVHGGQAFTSNGLIASGNLFRGLGVNALLGRTIAPEDDRPEAPPVTVLTYRWWERYAGLDPGILGQTVMLNGAGYTVIGVLPPEFSSPAAGRPVDFYVPMAAQPQIRPDFPLQSPKHWWLEIMARLPDGADERQAQAALQVLFARTVDPETSGQRIENPAIVLDDGSSGPMGIRRRLQAPLFLLMGVVGLVLLIASANLGGLLLARGAARRHEMALRTAVGGGRLRLVRQMLTESLLLSVAGGGLGLAVAGWGRRPLIGLLGTSEDLPQFDFATDFRVLLFTFVVAVVTALLFGLVPALRISRSGPWAGLKDSSAQAAPRLRLGRGLVAVQVALSLLLLVGAGLFVRSLDGLLGVDPGFRADSVLTFRLNAQTAGYEGRQLAGFYEQVRQSVAAIPGVQSVSVSQVALLGGRIVSSSFTTPGRPSEVQANHMHVGESFLKTMEIPILIGRDFTASDQETSTRVAIVNEAVARALFDGESPVGRTIRQSQTEFQIVGVCRDASYQSLSLTPPTVYFHYGQHLDDLEAMYIEARTAVPPLSVAPAVRRVVAALDPNVPLTELKTQTALIDESIMPYRLFAIFCGFFAGLALVLSAIGLYGVVAYGVTRRTGEIGIRMAFGAGRGDVLWMVLREALILLAAGVALGLPAALAATAVARSALYGIEFSDPAPLAGAAVLLLLVTLVAAVVPARRAARIHPMEALRSE